MTRLLFASGVAGALLAACAQRSMTPGKVRVKDGDPIVMIEAGNAEYKGGRMFVRYVIDRATQTCWISIWGSSERLQCCELARVQTARQYITWAMPESCPPD